jgi:hypothetical protein
LSSSEILAEPLKAQQKAGRPTGLIALLCVFALCLAAVVYFFINTRRHSSTTQNGRQSAAAAASAVLTESLTPKNLWMIRGALSEACTCAVPCTCNFGDGPSPHSYCWPFYSYHIREGYYRDIKLDGLHFGSADLKGGRTLFIDERADERQREALRIIIARMIIRVPAGEAEAKAKELAEKIRYVAVKQEYDGERNRLEVAGVGSFSADYIMGLDKSQPVVVRNNTTWRIHDAIKARTSAYKVKSGPDAVETKNTNSNQGDFEYTDEMDFGGPARWNCGACANEKAHDTHKEPVCGT